MHRTTNVTKEELVARLDEARVCTDRQVACKMRDSETHTRNGSVTLNSNTWNSEYHITTMFANEN